MTLGRQRGFEAGTQHADCPSSSVGLPGLTLMRVLFGTAHGSQAAFGDGDFPLSKLHAASMRRDTDRCLQVLPLKKTMIFLFFPLSTQTFRL